MKTTILTTCDLCLEEALDYVNELPKYERVEGNIIEITDWNNNTFKFVFEGDVFKVI